MSLLLVYAHSTSFVRLVYDRSPLCTELVPVEGKRLSQELDTGRLGLEAMPGRHLLVAGRRQAHLLAAVASVGPPGGSRWPREPQPV